MDETSEQDGQEQAKKSENNIMDIGNSPVMQSAVDVLTMLGQETIQSQMQ